MLPLPYRKKFISLDLETTHLDMRQGKIMEIGAVECELICDKTGKVEISFGKVFDTLVNPETAVSSAALAITGIAEQELALAPKWSEVKPKLAEFLGESFLCGHNLDFDLKYLQNQGLKLKNFYIDTLEISQTLYPLSASHSLEFLSEGFSVREGQAHRALSDSKATASVLAAVLNFYLSLSSDTRGKIFKLLEGSKLTFSELVMDLPEPGKSENQKIRNQTSAVRHPTSDIRFPLEDKTIISFPLGFNQARALLQNLASQKKKLVTAVANEIDLDFLPKDQVIPDPFWALCEVRAKNFLEQEGLSDIGRKILIKLLIFQAKTNSLDLSLARWTWEERGYLGAITVKPVICAKHKCKFVRMLEGRKKPVFTDLFTLFGLVFEWSYALREAPLLLFSLSAIEEDFTEKLTETWSLRKIRAAISALYPINNVNFSMLSEVPEEVERVANELDLFFGMLHLVYLKAEGDFAENIVIDEAGGDSERFQKLLNPAQKLVQKLNIFSEYLSSRIEFAEDWLKPELENLSSDTLRFAKFVEQVFLDRKDNFVYWLKFNDAWVELNVLAKNLQSDWTAFADNFKSVSIADTNLPEAALGYYHRRLGINNYQTQSVTGTAQKVKINLSDKALQPSESLEFLAKFRGRSLIVLPNESMLEEYFTKLVKKSIVPALAYKFSGSISSLNSKLASGDCVFLITTHGLRSFRVMPGFDRLVIFRLPFEPSQVKPSLLGIDRKLSFIDHVLPRSVHLLHQMITRFLSNAGENPEVFVLDPRVMTEYDRAFVNYFEEYPDFVISDISTGKFG